MTFLWDGSCCTVFIFCTISEYFKPQLIERHLTITIQFVILDLRNPASPAAVKKRRQRLKMSQKKKYTEGKGKTFQECKTPSGNQRGNCSTQED